MSDFVILHVAPLTFGVATGINMATPIMIQAQNALTGVSAGLLNSRKEATYEHMPYEFPIFGSASVLKFGRLEQLPEPFNRPDLVVFHSTYIPEHYIFSIHVRNREIPYILVPHGGMTKEAQSIKRIKKKLGNITFFNSLVRHAIAVQYLTDGEARESIGWNTDFIVCGNGVDLPDHVNVHRPKDSIHQNLNLAFIGRLDTYIKGLDLLIEACALIQDRMRAKNLHVHIYGPDSSNNRGKLQTLIDNLGLYDIVKIHGPVYGKDKEEVLLNTHIFVHTSRSEGHPMSVLEALSYGVPCLLTPGTNMSGEVVNNGAGWEVQPNALSIATGLETIIAESSNLEEMSKNAIKLVAKNYTRSHVANVTVDLYRRLLAQY